MLIGAHVVLYSRDAEADRDFLGSILRFPGVDAGHGWRIFALPPAEVAVHPSDGDTRHELYLMCDDLQGTMALLQDSGVQCAPPTQAGWGTFTTIALPGGSRIGLYEPHHPIAAGLNGTA
jgi:catechol 2,3-dioxygenase-like lactoylglutathione lyase family enzyme